ncbi:MAG: hypothetical protein M3R17_20395 [Bacteroidota bacterium]|nr:hypothetical protein [Bacteroidota bacterium]
MKAFSLNPGEKLLINDPHAMWMKSEMMAVMGTLKLTDKRLVFVKNANPFAGILALFMKSQRSHVLHEYMLGKINSYSKEKHFKSERIVIDNGIDRPKKYATSKIASIEMELKNNNVKNKE